VAADVLADQISAPSASANAAAWVARVSRPRTWTSSRASTARCTAWCETRPAFQARQRPHGVGQALHAAQPATGTALQRARPGLALDRAGLELDIGQDSQLRLGDLDVHDVFGARHGLGHGEAPGQVFDIVRRGHQHRVGPTVERQAHGDLLGRGAGDGLGPGSDPPLGGGTALSGGFRHDRSLPPGRSAVQGRCSRHERSSPTRL
jgi:hypothetical protein